ncbi:MAG TPA: nucleotide excision repair endonuclease, partial [Pirellulaceae bacterium]|nr:nucleotide excision repair endonuclease [Pirellulaceae bacterium]
MAAESPDSQSPDSQSPGSQSAGSPSSAVEIPYDPVGAAELEYRKAARKVREFPQKPGVYLMKDAAGRVIYVGKATNLRSRASSYFQAGANEEFRTQWVHEICDADY